MSLIPFLFFNGKRVNNLIKSFLYRLLLFSHILHHSFFIDFFIFLYYNLINKKVGVNMKVNINPNWNYNQIISNLKALKHEYHHVLASFSYFHLHDKVLFITETKKQIYSLNFEKWKCDRIWETINNDFQYDSLLSIARREKRRG